MKANVRSYTEAYLAQTALSQIGVGGVQGVEFDHMPTSGTPLMVCTWKADSLVTAKETAARVADGIGESECGKPLIDLDIITSRKRWTRRKDWRSCVSVIGAIDRLDLIVAAAVVIM